MFLSQIYTLLSLQKTKQTKSPRAKTLAFSTFPDYWIYSVFATFLRASKGTRADITSPHRLLWLHITSLLGTFTILLVENHLKCLSSINAWAYSFPVSLQCPRYRQEIASWATVLWRDSDLQKKIPSHSLMVESNIRQFMVTLFFKLFFALTDQGVCHNTSLGGKNERGKQFNWLGKVWKSVRGQVTLNVLKPSSKPKTSFIIIVMNI